MINKVKEIVGKIFQQPYQIKETAIPPLEESPYSEMIVSDLQNKYEGKTFGVPINLIDFDAVIASMIASDHPAIKDEVTEPYKVEDFPDMDDEIAQLMTDYMNTRLKLLINAVIQTHLADETIKMSVDEDGVKYYTEEPDEDIDELIKLERSLRAH